jgi:hypothetical protein
MLSKEYILKLLIITGVLNSAWLSVPEKSVSHMNIK